MDLIFYIFIFIFGLIIGSFLNVVIFRLETGETVIHGRSHCRHCAHFLEWYDLVPIISFLALGGKCRYCKKSLSIQYPLVELATGILFVLSLRATFGSVAISSLIQSGEIASSLPLLAMTIGDFIFYLFIISSLIVIFVYDLKHYIIPDKIVYSAIVISLIYLIAGQVLGGERILEAGLPGSFFGSPASGVSDFRNWDLIGNWKLGFGIYNSLLNGLLAAFLASGFFFAIVVITKGAGMGGGDIKLAFLMGLALGWPKILLALFLAFTAGAVYGIILMIMRRKTLKSEIPFGPFLVAGTIFAMFWGEKIVKWYGGYLF